MAVYLVSWDIPKGIAVDGEEINDLLFGGSLCPSIKSHHLEHAKD